MTLSAFGNPLLQNYATQEAVQSLIRQVKMWGAIYVLVGSLYSGLRGHQKLFFTTGHFLPTPGPSAFQKSLAVTGLRMCSFQRIYAIKAQSLNSNCTESAKYF